MPRHCICFLDLFDNKSLFTTIVVRWTKWYIFICGFIFLLFSSYNYLYVLLLSFTIISIYQKEIFLNLLQFESYYSLQYTWLHIYQHLIQYFKISIFRNSSQINLYWFTCLYLINPDTVILLTNHVTYYPDLTTRLKVDLT